MKLYYSSGTCAMAVWITLEWAGADYEVEEVELGSEEYKKINPAGTVPAIDSGDGEIKTQLPALINYITNLYPEADLGPDEGPEAIYEYDNILAFLTTDFHPAYGPVYGAESLTTDQSDQAIEAVRDAGCNNVNNYLKQLDAMVEGKKYIYRNKKTALDAVTYIFTSWSSDCPKSWEEYPNLKTYMKNIARDDLVRKIVRESSK